MQCYAMLWNAIQYKALIIDRHYHGREKNHRPSEVDLDSPKVGPVVGASLHHTDLGQVGEQSPLPSQLYPHPTLQHVSLTS